MLVLFSWPTLIGINWNQISLLLLQSNKSGRTIFGGQVTSLGLAAVGLDADDACNAHHASDARHAFDSRAKKAGGRPRSGGGTAGRSGRGGDGRG